MRRIGPLLLATALLLGCATSPTGRRQLQLYPDAEMAKLGATAFSKMSQEMPLANDPVLDRRVRCVVDAIAAEVTGDHAGTRWEVKVFDEPTPNAFALPGGKIGVHRGLFEVATNQHQLATVLGHEVAHVVARHANERVSNAQVAQAGLSAVEVLSGAASPAQRQLLGLLGVGAQVGVLLPFTRQQEAEADAIGLEFMAKAGFDPSQSVALWRNMAAAGGGQPPEFLSTHPSHGTRIQELERRMPGAMLHLEGARQRGRSPSCWTASDA